MGYSRGAVARTPALGVRGTYPASATNREVVVSFGSGTGVPPGNGHGQDGRATANDTTTHREDAAPMEMGSENLRKNR